MNKTPSILVDTGFEVDQNGALEGFVMPKVVTTLNAPRRIVFEGQTLNYIPSTAAALQEFEAPYMTDFTTNNILVSYNNLTTLKFPSLENISLSGNSLNTLAALSTFDIHNIKTISVRNAEVFTNLGITALNLDELTSMSATDYGTIFKGCINLVTVNLSKIKTMSAHNTNGGIFSNCGALQSVTLGSEGQPVSSLSNSAFKGCTQSGLTITIYTVGGASLSGAPWGATNATIVYEEA